MDCESDDVIELNVGGQTMATKRSTLCQVEGSLLSSMFSGRWDDSMSRDKDGRIFLDFDPTYFAFILVYLRAKKISAADKPATLPKVPSNQVNNYRKLIEYLGLADEMFPKLTESFTDHSPEIKLEENGAVAAYYAQKYSAGFYSFYYSQPNNAFVFGQNIYERGVTRLKLKVECPDFIGTISVGMLRGDVTPDLLQYYKSAFQGWEIQQNLGFQKVSYTGGECSYLNSKQCPKLEYTIELILDCEKSILYLKGPDGNIVELKLPEWNTWRLLVKLMGLKGHEQSRKRLGTDVVFRICILECHSILP